MTEETNPRKRSAPSSTTGDDARTGGPLQTANVATGATGSVGSSSRQMLELEENLRCQLEDPRERNKALNHLLKESASYEATFTLVSDRVLRALARIFGDCIGWPASSSSTSGLNLFYHDEIRKGTFRCTHAWTNAPTPRLQKWIQHCQTKLQSRSSSSSSSSTFSPNMAGSLGGRSSCWNEEDYRTMEAILMILRNLSFVGGNHRLLAYSPDIVAILVGCMHQSYRMQDRREDTANRTLLSTMAASALLHLAPYFDVTGQKMLADRLFFLPRKAKEGPAVPEPDNFGLLADARWGMAGMRLAKRLDVREDTISHATKDFILSLTADFVCCSWSVFSGICAMITHPRAPRQVILCCLDLLQEFINQARIGIVGNVQRQKSDDELPTLRMILVEIPNAALSRLVEFLFVPRQGPDSLDYVDPTQCVVSRVLPSKLMPGYDAMVDTELRDKTLDILVPLLELDSPRMARRLGYDSEKKRPRFKVFDLLISAVNAKSGRQDTPVVASTLLREMSRAPENKTGLLYIESRILGIAGRDSRVAQVCWKYLYPSEVENDEMEVEEQ